MELATAIARELSISVFASNVRRFANNEIVVLIPKHFYQVIVVTSTVTNEDWIELFFLLNALREAERVILCMPYMGYSRQNISNQNESFGVGVFSHLLEQTNVSYLIILDNHCELPIGMPYTHISAEKIFITDIGGSYRADDIAIVSPDIGGARRANGISKALGCDLIICNKVRDVFGELKKTDVLGNVTDKICVIVDDIVDSGATICSAVDALQKVGCRGVMAYATHGILSQGAVAHLEKSSLTQIILTDSVGCTMVLPQKFRKLSVASLMADSIRYIL
jgi:ribose-phosphate pyrophosphokinase